MVRIVRGLRAGAPAERNRAGQVGSGQVRSGRYGAQSHVRGLHIPPRERVMDWPRIIHTHIHT